MHPQRAGRTLEFPDEGGGSYSLLDTSWVPDAGRSGPSPLYLFLLVTLQGSATVPILELMILGLRATQQGHSRGGIISELTLSHLP